MRDDQLADLVEAIRLGARAITLIDEFAQNECFIKLEELRDRIRERGSGAPVDRNGVRMDLYSELAEALGTDPLDSHESRVAKAKRLSSVAVVQSIELDYAGMSRTEVAPTTRSTAGETVAQCESVSRDGSWCKEDAQQQCPTCGRWSCFPHADHQCSGSWRIPTHPPAPVAQTGGDPFAEWPWILPEWKKHIRPWLSEWDILPGHEALQNGDIGLCVNGFKQVYLRRRR